MITTLIVAEHEDGQIKLATLSAVAFAAKVCAEAGGSYKTLVRGENINSIGEQLTNYGASAVLLADHPQLKNPLADKYAHAIAEVARQRASSVIVAAASTFSKDI